MSRLCEYTGLPNPYEDIGAFVKRAEKKYPGIKTIEQMRQFIVRATNERKARYKIGRSERVMRLYGADIMSDMPLVNLAWQYIPQHQHSKIMALSIEERERHQIVKGLSQTYVWCFANAWLQDVTDDDYETIMTSPFRRFFKDPEVQGFHVEIRAYNPHVVEAIGAKHLEDGPRILAERKSKNYVSGARVGI